MTLERMRTRSGEDCLSDLQLDALALGVLDDAATKHAEAHLATCERCSERRRWLAEATRGSADVVARLPSPRRQSSLGPSPGTSTTARRAAMLPPRGAWLGAAGAALAAAAALLLFIGRSPLPSSDGVRSKGTSRVGYFVKHAGNVRRGNQRERVSPGDALRFVVTSSEPRYVAVLSRDGAGQVSVYHPNGPRAERIEPGVERALDASVVLDEVLGEERLYALVCSAPIEVAGPREALRATAAEPAWPAECSIERFVLLKEVTR